MQNGIKYQKTDVRKNRWNDGQTYRSEFVHSFQTHLANHLNNYKSTETRFLIKINQKSKNQQTKIFLELVYYKIRPKMQFKHAQNAVVPWQLPNSDENIKI